MTCCVMYLNPMWLSDAIWRQQFGSKFARVKVCCLMAPSHYLNQCCLIINEVLWHPAKTNFSVSAHETNLWNEFEKYTCETDSTSLNVQWFNHDLTDWTPVPLCLIQEYHCWQKYIPIELPCTFHDALSSLFSHWFNCTMVITTLRMICNAVILPYNMAIFSKNLTKRQSITCLFISNEYQIMSWIILFVL